MKKFVYAFVIGLDYGLALGFDSKSLITALLITQFVGFPAALLYGYLGQRWGMIPALYAGMGAYVVITYAGSELQSSRQFYVLAVAVGLVQGGIQALSRAYFSRLIPTHLSAEFFGFYNMMGKSAAILGPLLVGWFSLMFESNRLGLLSIMVLFVAGAAVLRWHQRRFAG